MKNCVNYLKLKENSLTINKANYEAVLAGSSLTAAKVDLLSSSLAMADPSHPFNAALISIFENLENIESWANAVIEQANQEEQNAVMNNFLSELKVVFERYTASISTASFEDGYGIGYGEPGTGFILTATLDNVISTKEIRKAVINSEDLV